MTYIYISLSLNLLYCLLFPITPLHPPRLPTVSPWWSPNAMMCALLHPPFLGLAQAILLIKMHHLLKCLHSAQRRYAFSYSQLLEWIESKADSNLHERKTTCFSCISNQGHLLETRKIRNKNNLGIVPFLKDFFIRLVPVAPPSVKKADTADGQDM